MTDTPRTDKSRRTFLKKSALASGVAALGLANTGGTAAAQVGQQANTALVFVNDYQPGVPFQMVSRIQQPTVDAILGQQAQDGDAAVSDPSDYNGYIYNYLGCGPGNYNVAFLREGTLERGQRYLWTINATFFSNELQLLEVEVNAGDGGGGGGGGGDGGGGDG